MNIWNIKEKKYTGKSLTFVADKYEDGKRQSEKKSLSERKFLRLFLLFPLRASLNTLSEGVPFSPIHGYLPSKKTFFSFECQS